MNIMNDYEYSEGIEFNGLMPKVMKADGVETIGKELQVVDFFGTSFGGNGGDNNHEYVDLGLPSGTLWSTENIKDANGNELYFAWGETQGYTARQIGIDKNFVNKDYKYYNNSVGSGETYTKYNETDRKTVLDHEDDAAIVNWGSDWRMPTQAKVIELMENTISALTQVDGVNGVMLTSTANGNTLFFPAVGYAENSALLEFGADNSRCWTASLGRSSDAIFLEFNVGKNLNRYVGLSVRPVRYQNI